MTATVGRVGDKVKKCQTELYWDLRRRGTVLVLLMMELPGRRQRGRPKKRPMG